MCVLLSATHQGIHDVSSIMTSDVSLDHLDRVVSAMFLHCNYSDSHCN